MWSGRLGCIALAALVLVDCHDDARFATLREEVPPLAVVAPSTADAVLANGLRVAILRDPRAPIVSIDLRYEVGAADDPPAAPGLALDVAHLLARAPLRDRGSGAPPDVALTLAVAVDLDRTELTSTALDGDLDAALELEARRLETSCADFEPAAIARAAAEATAQLGGPPPSLAAAVFGPEHPYAHPLGIPGAAAPTAEQLCAFFTDRYTPAAATLVVTGPLGDQALADVRARFERIPRGRLAPRAPVGAIEPTRAWTRLVLLGLARPTAMLAFPALGAPDPQDADVQLAVRRLESQAGLHVFVLGGERVRAIVLARDADTETDLGRAHEKLESDVETAGSYLGDDDDEVVNAGDQIAAAERADELLTRGGDLAARLAHPQAPRERDTSTGAVRRWIRTHLVLDGARRLDAIPAGSAAGASAPLDALAQPPASVDTSLEVGDPAAPLARPRRVTRPLEQLALPNGLHVVLAPDAHASTIDLRLVLPVGTRNATTPAIAERAAAELIGDGKTGNPNAREAIGMLSWYAKLPVRTSVDVSATTTRFRSVGLPNTADWHVFALAWLVMQGHYSDDLARDTREDLDWFRAQAYRPTGATLIVTGAFDPAQVRASVTTWFGPWRVADGRPLPVVAPRAVTLGKGSADGALEVTVTVRPSRAAATPAERAARSLAAEIVQRRLATALGDLATAAVTYQPRRDEALAITLQLDPASADPVSAVLAAQLARLHADLGVTPAELSRARRVLVAEHLGASIGPAGRSQQLQQAVETGAPLDEAALEVDAMRGVGSAELQAAAASLLAPAVAGARGP